MSHYCRNCGEHGQMRNSQGEDIQIISAKIMPLNNVINITENTIKTCEIKN